jgi:eukaryotic-like serine/threonine-protein kinase
MIGQRIGHCEIIHRLGEGGVGQVFAAVDRTLDRPVAIKALRPEHSRDATFIARFKAEAGALAAVNDPGIAAIYSLELLDDQHFMILELVRGITLEALLAKVGALDETAALALAAQALSALGAAHAAGIVHRDIKPANLMVTPAGVVKLMDFGIARVCGSGRMTRYGHVIGTLAYISPEQIQGQEGDLCSDLYSFGIVLYESLAGRPPFEADTEYGLLKAQMELPAPPLRPRVPGLSQRFHDAVMRCLEKDPARRFADAGALELALGTQKLDRSASAILCARIGATIEQATLPLARIIDEARCRSARQPSRPPPAAPATRYAARPTPPGKPRPAASSPPPSRQAGWRSLAAVAAA